MNKKIVANALALTLIAGVAGTCNLAFVRAEDDENSVNVESMSGNDVSGNDVEAAEGDINGDGKVNYLDSMMILRYSAELTTLTDDQLALADVTGDGKVDYMDAIMILRYDAQLIDSFATTSDNDVA